MKALLCLLYICVAGVAATGQQAFASSVTSSASTGKHAVTSTAGKAQSTSASTAGDASSLSTTASTQSTSQITSSSARSTSASTTVAATTGGTHYQPAGDPCTGVNIVTTRKGTYIPPYAPIGQRYGLQVFHFNGQGRNMLLAGALVQGSDPIPVRSVLADIQAVTTEFSCDYYEHDLWWSWSELMASGLNSAVVPVGGKTGTTFTYDYTGMVACALGSSTASYNPLYLWKTYDPTTLVTAIHVNSPTTMGDRVVVEIPLAGVISSAYELRDATYWTEKLYLLWANEMCLNWATHRSFGNYTLAAWPAIPWSGTSTTRPPARAPMPAR